MKKTLSFKSVLLYKQCLESGFLRLKDKTKFKNL
ncbi:MAG: hypothetical protein RI956_214 [Pseudomonadota bacterium]|jgi:hypothetical protein